MIIPFAKIDGYWTFDDNYLSSVFDKMAYDGSHKKVFWDGRVKTSQEFINYLKDPKNLPVFVFENDELKLFAWINSIGRNYAFVHYCTFNRGEDKTNIIDEAIGYWFGFEDEGKPLFDVLIGMTPTNNKHAIKFLEKCGFTQVGSIPDMADDVYRGKTSIMISYRKR